MTDTEDDTRMVELSVPAAEYDRLQTVSDDPDTVLADALRRELRVREGMAAVEARRRGEADESIDLPSPGPPSDSPIGTLLGWEIESLGDGEAVLSMEATSRHANRGGPVQGGVITALADTTTAVAFMTTLEEGESTTNIELKINFLRPVFEDRLEATATVVNRGRTLGLVQCDVHTSEGKLVARLSTTYMVLRGDQAEGR
ncbi:PaaI family thioesterase [Natrinema sp. 1APR25-10V2]|uniref:PaaI family thioesterase n=1 Tax=Natrinema sp. 1APR25-10V2 TaxID=2951081 RepID=UPI002875A352|nr:PaaI family thioesterase [Natrinema sp. 1APR25-10V2]MDS0477044.1 PaaI family thioesterase [Natrinema sp. 1APR25-10V2]